MSHRYLRSFCRNGLSSLFRGRTKRLLCMGIAIALLYLIIVSVLRMPKQTTRPVDPRKPLPVRNHQQQQNLPSSNGAKDQQQRAAELYSSDGKEGGNPSGKSANMTDLDALGLKDNGSEWQAVDLLGDADKDLALSGTGSPLKPFVSTSLELCPELRDNHNLTGHIGMGSLLIEDLVESEVSSFHSDLLPGGRWKPADCISRHKIAIIIPYRDRQSHLTRLLDSLIPLLKKQLLDFRFIVTEQKGEDLFNKGRLMNAAFKLAQELQVQCVIFHDVDMFPQDDRCPYDCPPMPRHLGAFVSNLGYQLWYQEIVGGALAIRVEDYEQVNGFSNSYWAWGGEDDDMGKRILIHNFTIERPNSDYVRFSMLKHVKRKRLSPKLVYKLLDETEKRWATDGVNETDKWRVVKIDVKPLYYHLLVDVGDPPEGWNTET